MANLTVVKRTRASIDDLWGSWSVTNEAPPYINDDLVEYRVATDIEILKRTRSTVDAEWGEWEVTLEAPVAGKYTDTDLVEYKVESIFSSTDSEEDEFELDINDLTNGELTVDNEWIGTGVFDKLMEAVNKNVEGQYNKDRITGPDYANVYLGSMQTVIAQSMQFMLREKQTEAQIGLTNEQRALIREQVATQAKVTKKAESEAAITADNEYVSARTRDDKIVVSQYKKETEEVNKDISVDTKPIKISLVGQQLSKLVADTNYVTAQKTALEEQVEDNRLIKAIDALGDTYGTFGAGGLTVSSDMWATYYGMITELTTQIAPASTTVTKVT